MIIMSVLKTKKDTSRIVRLQKQLTKTQRAVNLMIDSELLKRFKVKTAMKGETMTEILTGAIIEYLK